MIPKTTAISLLTASILLCMVLFGCSGGGGPVAPEGTDAPAGGIPDEYTQGTILLSDADVLIPDTTKIFHHLDDANLLSVMDYGSVYTFYDGSETAARVQPGDVIVGCKDGGYIRRVVSVNNSQLGIIRFVTQHATINDAVERADININYRLSPHNVREVAGLISETSGNRAASDNPEHFFVEFTDVVIVDGDGDPGTTSDQASITGSLYFEPVITMEVDIEQWILRKLHFVADVEMRTDLDSKIGGDLSFVDESVEIATYYFESITFLADGLPVVMTPRLTVSIGLLAGLDSEVMTSASMDFTWQAGLHYWDGELTPIGEVAPTMDCNPVSCSGDVNVHTFVNPDMDFELYGEIGPTISAKAYTNLAGVAGGDPEWEISGGLQVDAGVVLDLPNAFMIDLDWQWPVLDYLNPMCFGEFTGWVFKPPTAVAVIQTPAPYYIGTEVTFDGTASYDNDEDGHAVLSWRWDYGEGDGYELPETTGIVSHTYNDPGAFYVQCRVTDNEGVADILDASLQVVVLDPSAPDPPGPPIDPTPISFTVTPDSENPSYIIANISALIDGQSAYNEFTHDNFFLVEDMVRREDFEVHLISEGSVTAGADIVFIQDISGSMGTEINGVKNSVIGFAQYLADQNLDVRLGCAGFRSGTTPDRFFDLSDDILAFQQFYGTLGATGGTEMDNDIILYSHNNMTWRPGAQRIYIDIGDEDIDRNSSSPNTSELIPMIQPATIHTICVNVGVTGWNPVELSTLTGGLHIPLPYDGNIDLTVLPLGETISSGYIMRWLDPNPGIATDHEVRIGVFRDELERLNNTPWREYTGIYPY